MSKTNYKKIELEIRELVTGGRQNIYQIASRCLLLLSESDSYAAAVGLNPDNVLHHLDEYLADFAVSIDDVATMLKVFPNADQWTRPLREMLNDAEKAIKAADKTERENDAVPARKVIKKVEFDAVVKERNDAIYDATQQRTQVARLIAENDQLKAKVATLEGQVAELRRMCSQPA
jgi:hypothetical protein